MNSNFLGESLDREERRRLVEKVQLLEEIDRSLRFDLPVTLLCTFCER